MALILRLLCLCMLFDLPFAKEEVVVFVNDPAWDCVGSYVAHVPLLQEYKIVKVWTRLGRAPPCSDPQVVPIYQNITYNSWTPNDTLAAEDICPKLQGMGLPIAAVIPTFDASTYLANRIAGCVGVRGNPYEGPLAHARFDKWAMSQAVRKAGLRAAKERLVNTWSEAKEYLESLDPPLSHDKPIIFKLLQSSNSQGVYKIYSLKQAEEVFKNAVGSTTGYGDKVTEVLIQEFFTGKEYVVDSVSRDGVHKTVVVWYEDLRSGYGFLDLYYGFKLMDPKDEKTKVIMDYANKVLTATGVQNGASDMELFWVEEEGAPCVTDLNARWTGLMWHDKPDGLALENALTGTNQITATANALLDGDAFNRMPTVPSINQYGSIVFAHPLRTGMIRDIPGLRAVKKLPSYFSQWNEGIFVGEIVHKLWNSHPAIHMTLLHEEKAVVDKDYDFIVGLETSDAFFDIAPTLSYKSLAALPHGAGGSPNHWLPALAAFAMLTVAAGRGLVAMVRRNARVDTDYLTMSA